MQKGIIAIVFGLITGTAAGLIGVGGGEFRLPILLYLFNNQVKTAAGVNLIVGLFTVALSFARRWGYHSWTGNDITLALTFSIASLFGAVIGAWQTQRLSSPFLRRFICIYLFIIGGWMVYESITHSHHILLSPEGMGRIFLAVSLGFIIGGLSSAIGVAGGEMRIPILIYLFALPIKTAGTISLMASIPTVAAGALAYRRLGHISNQALLIALLMASGSLVGVLIGTSLLPFVNKDILKGILGIVLLLATVGLIITQKHEKQDEQKIRFDNL